VLLTFGPLACIGDISIFEGEVLGNGDIDLYAGAVVGG